MEIRPEGNYEELGLFLRATDENKKGYQLSLNPNKESVSLDNVSIQSVKNLRKSFLLDVIVKDDVIDVCVNKKRCIINRLPEQKGKNLFLYVKNGHALVKNIKIYKLKD